MTSDARTWDDAALQALLDARDASASTLGPVAVLPSTGSTNADAADQVREGAPEGFVVVADEQTTGRGRLGRSWATPAGSGLAASLVLRPRAPSAAWGWIPLLAGVAVVDAVRAAGVDAWLTWPNDVVVDGPCSDGSPGPRKLGGLLAERVEDAVVVGIGVNVDLAEDERPVARATSLRMEGVEVRREALLVDVLDRVLDRYAAWQAADGDADVSGLRAAFTERCLTLGRAVSATLPGGTVLDGVATGVGTDGALAVTLPGGETRQLSAGDVHLLR